MSKDLEGSPVLRGYFGIRLEIGNSQTAVNRNLTENLHLEHRL